MLCAVPVNQELNFLQLGFGESERLFAENILTSFQGCNNLTVVQIVSGKNSDWVYLWIFNNAFCCAAVIFKTEFISSMPGTQP